MNLKNLKNLKDLKRFINQKNKIKLHQYQYQMKNY